MSKHDETTNDDAERQRQLAEIVLARARDLAKQIEALVANAKAIQEREGLDGSFLNGVLIRAGIAVANTWPLRLEFLRHRVRHGWEAGWPAEEANAVAEALARVRARAPQLQELVAVQEILTVVEAAAISLRQDGREDAAAALDHVAGHIRAKLKQPPA